jgi:hypothetical protein
MKNFPRNTKLQIPIPNIPKEVIKGFLIGTLLLIPIAGIVSAIKKLNPYFNPGLLKHHERLKPSILNPNDNTVYHKINYNQLIEKAKEREIDLDPDGYTSDTLFQWVNNQETSKKLEAYQREVISSTLEDANSSDVESRNQYFNTLVNMLRENTITGDESIISIINNVYLDQQVSDLDLQLISVLIKSNKNGFDTFASKANNGKQKVDLSEAEKKKYIINILKAIYNNDDLYEIAKNNNKLVFIKHKGAFTETKYYEELKRSGDKQQLITESTEVISLFLQNTLNVKSNKINQIIYEVMKNRLAVQQNIFEQKQKSINLIDWYKNLNAYLA